MSINRNTFYLLPEVGEHLLVERHDVCEVCVGHGNEVAHIVMQAGLHITQSVEEPLDDDRRRHFLERSFQQTLRLSDLIQDVSVINKLEESAELFPMEHLDLRDVAQEAFDELQDRAEAAGISLHNRLPALALRGNHELLYRIFRNLADNAISYAGRGVDVVVETYQPANSKFKNQNSEYLFLHFYDNGRGVPDEYLARLFDRFVRIGEGRSRADGGTGLGLSIVKHAVLFHHGEIYAKNRAPGLEFYFSLKTATPSIT